MSHRNAANANAGLNQKLHKKTRVQQYPLDNKRSSIFNSNINNKYKLIPFNESINPRGETRYFPPASQEWKNSVYSYNQNTTKNFPVLDSSVYSIIKNYFNLYFNHNFIFNKLKISRALLRDDTNINEMDQYKISNNSYQKIFVSKPEIKHTNSKALITIYTYNRQAKSLLKKIKRLKMSHFMDLMHVIEWTKIFFFLPASRSACAAKEEAKQEVSSIFTKTIKYLLFKELILVRRLKLKLDLNKYKFEEKFLYKLSKLISRFYNKKVVFNIVNLKYVMFNSDIFTEILTSKLKDINAKPLKLMKIFLNKTSIPNMNLIKERTRIIKAVNFDLMSNRFRDININNFLSSGSGSYPYPLGQGTEEEEAVLENESPAAAKLPLPCLEDIFKDLYNDIVFRDSHPAMGPGQLLGAGQQATKAGSFAPVSFGLGAANTTNSDVDYKDYTNIYNTIFNSINYKNISGVRFEVKGRLTRRFRADRSVFKLKLKGGLRNIDSSYKGLSSVNFRGFTLPNVQYSINTSKRRVGAFAVKGWVSGK